MKQNDQVVLITGASNGIGLALAKIFAEKGYRLILTARNKTVLANVARLLETEYSASWVYILAKDLSKLESASELYEELRLKGIEVNILVNNAGFGVSGKYCDARLEEQVNEINVNVSALSALTLLFGADMVKRKSGKILNIASCAAFLPGPNMAVYFASKSYVLSFSMALYEELKKDNVKVSVLCPGPTKTNFAARARITRAKLFNDHAMEVDAVARIGFDGLFRNKPIIIPGFRNRMLVIGARLFPIRLTTKIAGIINR